MQPISPSSREARATIHAALGEVSRLTIVDRLTVSDASPGELARMLGQPTNLVAHHLRVLEEAGWIPGAGISSDHLVPGWPPDERTRRKLFFHEPLGSRHAHAHVRVLGHPNQRYPLLCRDYLRAHPHSAEAYATLKRDLASVLRNDSGRYADAKDAACDLIYFAAEEWARVVEWNAGPSDA